MGEAQDTNEMTMQTRVLIADDQPPLPQRTESHRENERRKP